ncbi:hypothetical protein HYC85_013791 [Camellia sinensis]|uniref:DUS-like FMN-binding domain-containing protein n=1 Tax=Camellia sinensis TaxID=4442 RepID=A0A7J7H7H9_CAMSI|nr:hypothetical protein HYC85_013791 [Camellia sinensis]
MVLRASNLVFLVLTKSKQKRLTTIKPQLCCLLNLYRRTKFVDIITQIYNVLYTFISSLTFISGVNILDKFLAYTSEQHPVVLQIGGSNLEDLAKAAELANAYCYDEINFNQLRSCSSSSCGCPSPKVAGHGCFGVRLMLDPEWVCLSICSDIDVCFLQEKFVAEAMSVIAANSDAPVSVKCRIGVDDHDSYNELCKLLLFTLFFNIFKLRK